MQDDNLYFLKNKYTCVRTKSELLGLIRNAKKDNPDLTFLQLLEKLRLYLLVNVDVSELYEELYLGIPKRVHFYDTNDYDFERFEEDYIWYEFDFLHMVKTKIEFIVNFYGASPDKKLIMIIDYLHCDPFHRTTLESRCLDDTILYFLCVLVVDWKRRPSVNLLYMRSIESFERMFILFESWVLKIRIQYWDVKSVDIGNSTEIINVSMFQKYHQWFEDLGNRFNGNVLIGNIEMKREYLKYIDQWMKHCGNYNLEDYCVLPFTLGTEEMAERKGMLFRGLICVNIYDLFKKDESVDNVYIPSIGGCVIKRILQVVGNLNMNCDRFISKDEDYRRWFFSCVTYIHKRFDYIRSICDGSSKNDYLIMKNVKFDQSLREFLNVVNPSLYPPCIYSLLSKLALYRNSKTRKSEWFKYNLTYSERLGLIEFLISIGVPIGYTRNLLTCNYPSNPAIKNHVDKSRDALVKHRYNIRAGKITEARPFSLECGFFIQKGVCPFSKFGDRVSIKTYMDDIYKTPPKVKDHIDRYYLNKIGKFHCGKPCSMICHKKMHDPGMKSFTNPVDFYVSSIKLQYEECSNDDTAMDCSTSHNTDKQDYFDDAQGNGNRVSLDF